MTRLAGPTVALVPAPHDVAVDVLAGSARARTALAAHGLSAAPDWPHPDTDDALRPLAEHGTPGDTGTWLIALDGTVVGECRWSGAPDGDGEVELSYGLAPSARGRGLGTEAVAVLAAWTEQQPGTRLLTAEVRVGNEASLRLLARLGFTEQGSHPPFLRLVRPVPGLRRPRGRHVC